MYPSGELMSFYKYHVFFCTNERNDGSQCCGTSYGAQDARTYVKSRCKELGIHGAPSIRINNAGCLDRCDEGPVLVIYPEETWYTYVDKEDLDEIINSHLVNGVPVERLLLAK